MAFVIVLRDRSELARRELTGPVTVGRAPDCDVVVPDVKVSRHHCRIEPTAGGGWRARDLGSRNGTLMWDEPITENPLNNGDTVWLAGDILVHFGEGPMPARRPSHPSEALELVRSAAGSDPDLNTEFPSAPRPIPRAWESERESPDDVLTASTGTGLTFGKERPKIPALSAATRDH
jgi:predicted component of type VI protein secretion system